MERAVYSNDVQTVTKVYVNRLNFKCSIERKDFYSMDIRLFSSHTFASKCDHKFHTLSHVLLHFEHTETKMYKMIDERAVANIVIFSLQKCKNISFQGLSIIH